MEWTVLALRRMASTDQTVDDSRPWNYTDNCHMCGGVKAFIDWLAEIDKAWEEIERCPHDECEQESCPFEGQDKCGKGG